MGGAFLVIAPRNEIVFRKFQRHFNEDKTNFETVWNSLPWKGAISLQLVLTSGWILKAFNAGMPSCTSQHISKFWHAAATDYFSLVSPILEMLPNVPCSNCFHYRWKFGWMHFWWALVFRYGIKGGISRCLDNWKNHGFSKIGINTIYIITITKATSHLSAWMDLVVRFPLFKSITTVWSFCRSLHRKFIATTIEQARQNCFTYNLLYSYFDILSFYPHFGLHIQSIVFFSIQTWAFPAMSRHV